MSEQKQRMDRYWASSHYPCVIVKDRYRGSYSAADWVAWPRDVEPAEANGGDMDCMGFWDDEPFPVGKGRSPQAAFEDLCEQFESLAWCPELPPIIYSAEEIRYAKEAWDIVMKNWPQERIYEEIYASGPLFGVVRKDKS